MKKLPEVGKAANIKLMPSRFNGYFNNQGSVILTIFLTVMVIVGVGFVYYYYTKLGSLEPPPIPLVNSSPTPTDETASWKPYEKGELSMRIPNEWYISDDNQYVSQFPYNSRKSATADIYNVFFVTKTSLQLQSGYTNEDWLNRIDNLKPEERLSNEYRPALSLKLTKIGSGRTADGKRYVLFKNTAFDEGAIASFMNNETVYQFFLRFYDQNGLDTLQKIMTTVVVNPAKDSP